MLPYAGTPIEETLRQEGRLTGSLAHPDYNFLDARLDLYSFMVHRIFSRRNFAALGLANRLTLAHANRAMNHAIGAGPSLEADERRLWEITASSNKSALDTLEALLPVAQAEKPDGQVFLDLSTHAWESESASIIALDDLLLESDPGLLELFGSNIREREEQLQEAAAQMRRDTQHH